MARKQAGSPPPKKSSRSTKKRETKKSAAPLSLEIPDSFLDFPDWIAGPSEDPKIPDHVTQLVAVHVAWLKSQKERKMALCGEKERKRTRGRPPPLDELLAQFPIEVNEATPAPATVKKTAASRMMMRSSEIKEEIVTPATVHISSPRKPLPQAVTLLREAHESPRSKQHDSPRSNQHESPRSKLHESPRSKHCGTPSASSTAPTTPRRRIKTEKDLVPKQAHPTEDKCLKAIERKKLAAQEKADKIKKDNEEKKRKVDAKRKEQEAEAEIRRLDKLKKQEYAAEVRRLNASPARSRIASAVNTPSRAAPKTPSALLRVKAHLFASSTPVRTPGRAPAKAAKIEQPDGAGPINTNFGSAPREPKRKPVVRTAAASLAEEFAELPSTSKTSKKTSVVKKERDDSFAAAQMKFLMEHDGVEEDKKRESEETARLHREQQEEQERLRAEAEEEERQRKEERRRRRKEEEERRRKEEEEKLEKERQEEKRREEEERMRKEEEKRVREEQRRLQEEEERRRAEEEALRLVEEEVELEDDYENDIAHKLNQSILEDASEVNTEHNISVYDMTQDKIFQPSTAENYNIMDLSSGDETDDETAPRKKVPSWAEWASLTKTGHEQAKFKYDFTDMYGTMENPDSQGIFKPSMKPRRQRGSSAQWNSPASNPTKGRSRFLAQQQQ